MKEPVSIGDVPWTHDEMRAALPEFASMYEKRPIGTNEGGMRSPHAFLAWFVFRKLQPQVIIESGVWLGQGTWLLEQACPQAELYCIEPNLDRIEYRSARARYDDEDFSRLDWTDVPKDETVIFFDDHQDAYDRVKTCRWFGFEHLLFEDNYPPERGDCYSLKKVFMHAGHNPSRDGLLGLLSVPLDVLKAAVGQSAALQTRVPPNHVDARYLRDNLEAYRELPPVFRAERTRWGDEWTDEKYPTPEPLLTAVDVPFQEIFFREHLDYTWMCYAKIARERKG